MSLFSGSNLGGFYKWLGKVPLPSQNPLLHDWAEYFFFSVRRQDSSLPEYVTLSDGVQYSWSISEDLSAGVQQILTHYLDSGVKQQWTPATVVSAGVLQYWKGAYSFSSGVKQGWVHASILNSGVQQKWNGLTSFSTGVQQSWAVCGQQLSAGVQQIWSVSGMVFLSAGVAQPWADIEDSAVDRYSISVTIGGVQVLPSVISIMGGRDGYTMTCDITLPNQAEWLQVTRVPFDIATMISSDLDALMESSKVVVDDGYDTYTFYVLTKTRSRENGEITYTVSAESIARLLDAPYALPSTEEYDADMISTISEYIAMAGGYLPSFTWQLTDDYLPADSLYSNAETAITVLRKLSDAQGGMLQSAPDGSLSAMRYCPISPPDWYSEEVDYFFSDLSDFFSAGDTDDIRDGFNSFLISDHTTSSDSLQFEEVAISETVSDIYGYVIPWSDDELPLETSGPDRVAISAPEIVEELIENEQIEFIAGSGQTSKPILSIVSVDYGENYQLGAIADWSEDGTLTTEVSGQSLALISYYTKYWKWQTTDATAESVQFWAEPVWADTPVTIVVTYGDAVASDALVVVEADETLNVDSDGEAKSELAPGEIFYFLVHHDDTVKISSVTCSSGTISELGIVSREKTQQQSFVNSEAVELPTIPSGGVSASWYGREPNLTLEDRSVSVDEVPAIGELTWNISMSSYGLTPPDLDLEEDEKYYILVVVEVESV